LDTLERRQAQPLFIVRADWNYRRHQDLTPGANYDVPPDERGGPGDINFSPDGKEICFTAVDRQDGSSDQHQCGLIHRSGWRRANRSASQRNRDSMEIPCIHRTVNSSPNHAQLAAGYEADRWRVLLYDRAAGRIENLTETFDRSAYETGLVAGPARRFILQQKTKRKSRCMQLAARFGAEPKTVIADTDNTAFFSQRGRQDAGF